MLKLQTKVDVGISKIRLSVSDKILVIGSCFADSIGKKMQQSGMNVLVNPFGTLYNPVSICNSIARLGSGIPFTEDDCIEMGAGAGLICSYNHHTSFARKTIDEFLENANKSLLSSSDFFKECDVVIVTLGTCWVFRLKDSGEVVSNCLKTDAHKFTRERLPLRHTELILNNMVTSWKEKKFIFTVSPIRHMSDGAHGNQLSKCGLLLAEDSICSAFPDRCEYFPAYEIVMDELRDYRFYAEDMCHPSEQTQDYLWERFVDFAVDEKDKPALQAAQKIFRQSRHIPHQNG